MCGLPAPVLAGIAYCTASASMVLLNKFALSSFDFRSITMLLLFQCVFCVVAVYTSSLLGIIKLEVGNIHCSAFRLARRQILEPRCIDVLLIPATSAVGMAATLSQ